MTLPVYAELTLGVYFTLLPFLNFELPDPVGFHFLVTTGEGFHPFPSRTRPLSPQPPMVVGR